MRKHRISPTQVETYALCQRKWGWGWLDKVEVPQNRFAALGERVHAILEAWLKSGAPPDIDEKLVLDGEVYYPGQIAVSGLHHLPPPGPHHDVESWISVPMLTEPRGVWVGRVDSAYSVECEDGTRHPEILDHKTTSNLAYAKTEEDLRTGIQSNVYAYAAMHVSGLNIVSLRWVYYRTRKPYKSIVVRATLSRNEVLEHIARWETYASEMIDHAEAGKKAADLPVNPSACSAYGGCPHRNRCNLTAAEMVRSAMVNEKSLLEKIKAAKERVFHSASPPAEVAPVFASPPPPLPASEINSPEDVSSSATIVADVDASEDDSKVGDEFDGMDATALRKFAAEHGIPGIKGLREKNLRRFVRAAWRDRQLASSKAPPPAPQAAPPPPPPPPAPQEEFVLYVDCAPRRSGAVDAAKAFGEELRSVAVDGGVDDYRMIPYGHGPVLLELAVRRRQSGSRKVCGEVVIDTRTDIGRHLLFLRELADEVVAPI